MSSKRQHAYSHSFQFTTSNGTLQGLNMTLSSSPRPYQPSGAATYIIVVITIYALSIVLFIASHIRRKQDIDVHDKQVENYISGLPRMRQQETRRYSKQIMRQRLESSDNFRHILKTWEEKAKAKRSQRERVREAHVQFSNSDSSSDAWRSLQENDLDSLCSARMSRLSNCSSDNEIDLNASGRSGMEFGRYPAVLSDIPEVDHLSAADTDIESRPNSMTPLPNSVSWGVSSAHNIGEISDSDPECHSIPDDSFDCEIVVETAATPFLSPGSHGQNACASERAKERSNELSNDLLSHSTTTNHAHTPVEFQVCERRFSSTPL